ncbi:MAG: glycosyltransferase, partial [Candidatus Nanoarchaeia archaeon]
MKILFYDWALHSIGGGQKFNCKIAEYLAKQGHEIDILTLFPVNKKKLEDYYSVDISKINIIPLYEKNNIPPTILKLLVSTKISKLSEKYGVFFNADAQEIINPKAKYNIMYCHFFEPKWYRPSRGFIDWLKLSLIYLLKTLKGNYSKKYYVYCNSEYTKNWLHKLWKINLDNINVIYPPVDIPSKTIFKKENIILSTGRISPDKNYEFVIEVFKQVLKQSSENSLKNYKLYICGKSDDVGYLNKLKSLSKGLSIEFKTN